MKVDLNFSVVSRFFRGLLNDFGQKKLWPVAVVLLAGIVAVPVLLAKSSSPAAAPQASLPTPPPATGTSLPTVNVQSTATGSTARLTGPAHNPFTQGNASAGVAAVTTAANNIVSRLTGSNAPIGTSTTPTSATGTSSAGSSSSGSSSSTSSSTTSSSSGSPTTSSSGSTPSITGNAKPKPAPAGLTATQSYDVAMAITNSAGGVNTVDPLDRLSLVPNNQQPLLVELGVLKGGSRVLFAVEHGAIVNGPGTCTPGPIDCEILSLAQDQTESVTNRDNSANALFAITGISAVSHSSASAANKARAAKSEAGQAVLDGSNLPTLMLFKYEPSVGAVVDLRDLTVGG